MFFLIYHYSVIKVINWNFHNIFRQEVLLDKGFTGILFFVLINVENFLYSSLLYYFCTRKTRKIRCVKSTSCCFSHPHFNQSRLLSMKTQTLIQLFALIIITPIAAKAIARWKSFWGSVVTRRNYSVFIIDNYCTYWGFHAIGSPTSDICYFHEILVPSWPEVSDNILLLTD